MICKTLDEYLDDIKDILDDAAMDKSLSKEHYADLCGEVWTEAQMRCEAAMADLDRYKEQK